MLLFARLEDFSGTRRAAILTAENGRFVKVARQTTVSGRRERYTKAECRKATKQKLSNDNNTYTHKFIKLREKKKETARNRVTTTSTHGHEETDQVQRGYKRASVGELHEK
eukprot:6199125-Pleurochrysis_carterae.AAC.4